MASGAAFAGTGFWGVTTLWLWDIGGITLGNWGTGPLGEYGLGTGLAWAWQWLGTGLARAGLAICVPGLGHVLRDMGRAGKAGATRGSVWISVKRRETP